jgi:hypothetical protein
VTSFTPKKLTWSSGDSNSIPYCTWTTFQSLIFERFRKIAKSDN